MSCDAGGRSYNADCCHLGLPGAHGCCVESLAHSATLCRTNDLLQVGVGTLHGDQVLLADHFDLLRERLLRQPWLRLRGGAAIGASANQNMFGVWAWSDIQNLDSMFG